MNLLEMAQEFVRRQDAEEKEEYWETNQQRAEDVLCTFLRDNNMPVWKVTHTWINGKDTRSTNHYFVLEETADKYIKEQDERWATIPVGYPTRTIKCLTEPNKELRLRWPIC